MYFKRVPKSNVINKCECLQKCKARNTDHIKHNYTQNYTQIIAKNTNDNKHLS